MILWLRFFLLAGVIFFAGRVLVSRAERIAAARGWTQLWSGFILLSLAATLPETFTSASAVTVARAPDLALGNLFGSVAVNIFIIAVLDLLQGPGPILKFADNKLILCGAVNIIMASAAVLGISTGFSLLPLFSSFSVVIVLAYVLGVRMTYLLNREGGNRAEPSAGASSIRRIWVEYLACAFVILLASAGIVRAADALAETTGWGRTFFGTLFLGAVTSLPEVTVAVAAIRRGAYNMAVGTILGANMFNLVLVAVCDFLYPAGSILSAVSPSLVIAAVLGILMTAIMIAGIMYRSEKSFVFLGWDSAAIAVSYVAGCCFLFYSG